MPRILFVTSTPLAPWRGASHRVRHDLAALIALGHTVDFLAPPGSAAPDVPPGVRSLSTPLLPFCRNLPPGPSLRRFVTDVVMAAIAVAACNRHAYDLMHGIDDGGIVTGLAGRLTKTPWVYERTGDFVPERPRGLSRFWHAVHRLLEQRALRHASAVIGNDTGMVELFSRLNCRSRACVIPDIPAIDEEISTAARNLAMARYRTSPDQKLITCVGSYTRFQGLDLFFNAMPHVLSACPHARFVVVGGDTAEIRRMNEALDRAGIADSVCFPGRIETVELAALLSVSDVLVSPRRAGVTAPIKVLDYLKSGTPIVAADTPANRAILSAENAVMTRPIPAEFAEGIVRLCESPHLGAELVRQGRETLRRERRSPQAFRQALDHCYAYVLSTT